MKTVQLFLVTICVAVAFSMPSGEHDGKFKEKMKKVKECHKQTEELLKCCDMPKPEEMNGDTECKKEHLEGIEDKEGKEKGKEFLCFLECEFKSKGFLVDKEIKWDKLKEYNAEHKAEAPEFEEVGNKAMEFCEKNINEKIEMFKNFKPKHDKPPKDDGEKMCCMLPAITTGCLGGYIARDCPAEKWKDTEECNAIKANATSIEECMG